MHPIVIIGSGMAGYTVAREFRKLSPEQELVMICADDAVNYAKPTLSNAFAGNKAPEQIALGDAAKMATQLNMRIEAETLVKEINAEQHEITLEKNGEIFTQPYSKLVLAVGANPIRLAIAGDGSDDIHVVNSLIDYRTFRENLAKRKDKRVLILGAGLIGCEFANDLLHSNYDVTVIDLAPQPLGRLLPNHVAEAFKTNLEQAGIKFALSTTVEKVKQLYQNFFISNHAQIAITGDYQTATMLQLIQQELGSWKAKLPYQRLSSDYQAYSAQKIHALSEQREFGNYQAILTFPAGADHPDAPALIVFSYILGDSQLSSRLAQELREKNALVYSFGSGLNLDDWVNSGALTIEANYTAGKSTQVSQGVYKVLNDLLSQGVTEQELEAAKANILKKRVTALEDERNIHQMLTPQLERNRDLLFREKRDQALEKLTKADVDAVIKKYIKRDQLVEVMADQYGKPQSKR